jgi:hypothetical protein
MHGMQAWIDLVKRCIVMELHTDETSSEVFSLLDINPRVVRITVPIVSIKHMYILQEGGRHFLALRTRRPPHVTKSDAQVWLSLMARFDELNRQFHTATDPSACEAFAAPTGRFCLKFTSESTFRDARKSLQAFKISIRPHTRIVSSVQSPSLNTPSHRLPTLSSLQEVLSRIAEEAGDSSFRVQYALECLLKHGLLREHDVVPLLKKLLQLVRWDECGMPSRELDDMVARHPPVHRCNRGYEVHEEVCCLLERFMHVSPGRDSSNRRHMSVVPHKRLYRLVLDRSMC